MKRTTLGLLSVTLIAAALWAGSLPAGYPASSALLEAISDNRPAAEESPSVSALPTATPAAWNLALAAGLPATHQAHRHPEEFAADLRASFHPHGREVCASGCAVSNHPTETLGRARFLKMLEEFSAAPLGETSLALDTLLYFGRQSRLHLADCKNSPLDDSRQALLARELARTHARVELRLVDEHGHRRAWLPATAVPLDRRHEFVLEVDDLQPLVASGTVKRVGLDYLWARL